MSFIVFLERETKYRTDEILFGNSAERKVGEKQSKKENMLEITEKEQNRELEINEDHEKNYNYESKEKS